MKRRTFREILPVVSDLIADVEAINPKDSVRRTPLNGIAIGPRAIATYFALRRADAQRLKYSCRALCRFP